MQMTVKERIGSGKKTGVDAEPILPFQRKKK
jgi:hypothetical protein